MIATLPSTGHADYNNVHVNVSYMKHRKAIVVTAYPGIGTASVPTSQETEDMEPMTRLNAKKIEAAKEAAKQQIAAKSGPAWNAVKKVLDKNGMSL
jgi:hypothetical protein